MADTTENQQLSQKSKPSIEPCSSTSSEHTLPSSSTMDFDEVQKITPDKELLAEIYQSMQLGKRHLIVSDYRSAVPCFEQACELLNAIYGKTAPECAEAYLYYGTALYEMSRLEEGFDGGIVKVDNNNEDDESSDVDGDEEDEEDNGNADGEDNSAKEQTENDLENKDESEPETISENQNNDKTENEEQNNIDIDLLAQPSTSKGEPSARDGVEGGEKSEEDENDDNVTNIEIAYEVLTTAKQIFSQNLFTKESRLNYAEALQKLAEISIDWENLDGAIELFHECLEHRKALLDPDDRLIASTYHLLGLAYSLQSDFNNSNQSFQKSLDVIHFRIDKLKAIDTKFMDPFDRATHEREIEQLESLIPEIRLKIEDMMEQIQSQYSTKKTLENEIKQEDDKRRELMKEKPINNITHLIKRKRDNNGNPSVENDVGVLKKRLCTTNNGDQPKTTTTTTIEHHEITSGSVVGEGNSSGNGTLTDSTTNSTTAPSTNN